jgi:hypothetical protein
LVLVVYINVVADSWQATQVITQPTTVVVPTTLATVTSTVVHNFVASAFAFIDFAKIVDINGCAYKSNQLYIANAANNLDGALEACGPTCLGT